MLSSCYPHSLLAANHTVGTHTTRSLTNCRPRPFTGSNVRPHQHHQHHQHHHRAPRHAGHAVSSELLVAPGLRPEPWLDTPEQQQALELLHQRLSRSGLAVPEDATLKWYLRDRYFNVQEAEEKLTSMLRWKKAFQPERITAAQVQRENSTGKSYVHNRTDIFGRPVIVIRTRLHVVGQFPMDDSKRLCVHLLDTAISQLPPDSEQIVGIFDLKGFQIPRNADFAFAAFMVEAFFEYYPRRVGQVLLVDAPWVFEPAWAVIKPLLRKYAALVRFVSRQELRQEFFTPATVPADFL